MSNIIQEVIILPEDNAITHKQLYAVAVALEQATIADRKPGFFATYKDHSGWFIVFPTHPAERGGVEPPHLEVRFVDDKHSQLRCTYRHAMDEADDCSQIFAATPAENDPKRMFLRIAGRSDAKSLFEWALEQYDALHIQAELGLPPLRKPERPAEVSRKKPDRKPF